MKIIGYALALFAFFVTILNVEACGHLMALGDYKQAIFHAVLALITTICVISNLKIAIES